MLMAFLQMFFLLCPIFMHFIVPNTAQPEINFHLCVDENGNYTANSTYQANLNFLLSSVYSDTEIDYGFYNFSYGESSDKVYAIGLCRGDVKPDACRDCLNYSSQALTFRCPTTKEAIIGLDNCILRYANRNIFGLNEVAPYFFVYSLTNVSDENGFKMSVNRLLDSLHVKAAAGDSRRKYATRKINTPDFQTIYALSQCTPDLSQTDCSYCLQNASARIGQCCQERQGGRVIYPSCNFRYEINQFYEIPVGEDPSPPPSKGKNNTVIIIILSAVISVIAILIISFYTISRKRKSREEVKSGSVDDEITRTESLQYNLEIIHLATDNFSEVNKLGQGGFGSVYKGTLPNGQYIAVKRLSRDSTQGEQEFKNEALLVAKLQHKNLVTLLGFCLEQEERILIYEFMPNSSLDNFIFDQTKRSQLDWERRYKIIEGISRGLLYLHEDSRLRIIHRDLKPSNILLDAEMNAKISDFGMARLFAGDQTQECTSRVVGTFGYMPPEYVLHGHFSVKSDIFSFGVLVLQIVSGRKRSFVNEEEEDEDLLTYMWENWNSGQNLHKLIDPTLRAGSRNEMLRCIHVGLLCVQENALARPNMASVAVMLSTYSITLPVPQKPAFFSHTTVLPETTSTLTESDQSRSASVPFSNNEASISELHPR